MASEEYSKLVADLKEKLGTTELILPAPLGPISTANLNVLEGWRYILRKVGYPGDQPVLPRGGASSVILEITSETGWAVSGAAIFSSPYGRVTLELDDWLTEWQPYLIDVSAPIHKTSLTFFNGTYNPWTPLGPLYSVMFDPPYAQSYARRVVVRALLPEGSPVASCRLVGAEVGRIAIVDEREFMRSIKKHNLEQLTGLKLERYP